MEKRCVTDVKAISSQNWWGFVAHVCFCLVSCGWFSAELEIIYIYDLNRTPSLTFRHPSSKLCRNWLRRSFVRCCFTSAETIRTVRAWEPRMTTSTFTQLPTHLFSFALRPQRPYRPTIRDGEPRMATSTFTHLPTHLFSFALRPQRLYGLLLLLRTEVPRTAASTFT